MKINNFQKLSFSDTLDNLLKNLSMTGRSRKQAVAIAVDSILVVASLWMAYSLRHGVVFSDFKSTWHLFILLPLGTVIIFMALGIYRWVIRSSNRLLFRQIIKACFLASLLLIFVAYIFPPDRITPRSLFVIFGLLMLFGTSGVRIVWQGIFDSARFGEPVAIYGTGEFGLQLVNSLAQGSEYQPVVFLNDCDLDADYTLAGLPVFNVSKDSVANLLSGFGVERVILAMPNLNSGEYQQKVDVFRELGYPLQTIPTYTELMSGQAQVSQIRDISITDILGRAEVPPNPALLGFCVTNKSVLVTGGGGSIGSELCRQIILQNPKQLVVVDHSEQNLYQITEELSSLLGSRNIRRDMYIAKLCSVTDSSAIDSIIKEHQIDSVFHAAAYKHVPIIENQPEQGVNVNIFGTLCVLDAAIKHKAENFVLISTDKAVRPTNSMGATKRIAELILQAKARTQNTTVISMVRFGNVLGSSGSVVPKFIKQIDAGGPITLTDPNITRFFMTIPEAAQLVLQASAIAKGGEVFVLDMGKPVRIEDLAISMVKMAGRKLKSETGSSNDIDIICEGLRPGEKMYEELFIGDEHSNTAVQKVFSANEQWVPWEQLEKKLDFIESVSAGNNRKKLRFELLKLAFQDVSAKNDNENIKSARSLVLN